jgi:CheY-like chemotaxis protein
MGMSDTPSVLILVIEIDPYIQALETTLLHSLGYRAAFAPDGVAALAMARESLPRLLITDILVPKLDGLQVCRRLRSDPDTSRIKILIFSELLAERRALEAGADAFLRKPLDRTVFFATVLRLLEADEPRAEESAGG